MATNWIRHIECIVDNKVLNLDGFDIEFVYNFDINEEPNEFEVTLYNLKDDTINTNVVYGKQIIINAGYSNNVGNIAKGFILYADTTWNNETKVTTVYCVDASDTYLDKFIAKTYVENTLAMDIINDLVAQVGLTVGEVALNNNVQYITGRTVTGKLRDILKEIVQGDCQTNLQIINGTIYIRNIGEGLATGFILGADTGLIGSPEPVSSNETDDDDIQPDYKIKCLLNYMIGAMTRIKINSKYLQADAVVLRGTHTGSKAGDFLTEVEVKLV